jgi:hypothetical protein
MMEQLAAAGRSLRSMGRAIGPRLRVTLPGCTLGYKDISPESYRKLSDLWQKGVRLMIAISGIVAAVIVCVALDWWLYVWSQPDPPEQRHARVDRRSRQRVYGGEFRLEGLFYF